MAKFGRFEFKAQVPAETFEGDHMELDHKGYVRIFRGKSSDDFRDPFGPPTSELIHAVHLDKGQRMSEIN